MKNNDKTMIKQWQTAQSSIKSSNNGVSLSYIRASDMHKKLLLKTLIKGSTHITFFHCLNNLLSEEVIVWISRRLDKPLWENKSLD